MGTKLVARFHNKVKFYISPDETGESLTECGNTLVGLKISPKGVSSELYIALGEVLYAVWAESGDWDDLGYPPKVNANLVAVFKDLVAAKDFAKQLEEQPTKNKWGCLDGQQIDLSSWFPGGRYFEILDGVHVGAICVSV